jgi:hypothetical protein
MLSPWGTALQLVDSQAGQDINLYTITEAGAQIGRLYADGGGPVYQVVAVSYKGPSPEVQLFTVEHYEEPFPAAVSWLTDLGPEAVEQLIAEEVTTV